MVVAGMDIFIVKTGNMFVNPKVRAWIPVADGSQNFWSSGLAMENGNRIEQIFFDSGFTFRH